MLLDPAKVHHFEDFGYRHDWYYQCPANARGGQLPESAALGDNTPFSPELEGGIGCRCECDGRKTRNTPAYCLYKLTAPNKVRQPSMLQWATSWL
jgi:mannosyltransferase